MRRARARRLRSLAFALAATAVLVLAFGASLLAWTNQGALERKGGADSFGEISAAALGGAQRLLKSHEGARVVDTVPPPAAEVVTLALGCRIAVGAPARAVAHAPAPIPSLRL